MTPEQPQAGRDDTLARAFGFLATVLSDAAPPELPPDLAHHPEVAQLYAQLYDLRVFIFNLAQGDLTGKLEQRGYLAGALKSLQANLRHLTWQTQMIAAGDLSQQVDFMGDFSQAFNSMVASLIEARQGERRRATEAETLYQAGTIVAASLQQEEAVKRILAQLQRVVPYDRAFVLLLRAEQNAAQPPDALPVLEVLGSNGLPELGTPQKALYRPNPGGPAARVILSRQPLALDDLQTEALAFDFFSTGVHGWLGVPLI
ncbi:MAG TPA: hypothetical protein VLS48_06905, partial [Anaerolineales bacterium]|nr:hypothetical protein [Anaerolineales bacterium]